MNETEAHAGYRQLAEYMDAERQLRVIDEQITRREQAIAGLQAEADALVERQREIARLIGPQILAKGAVSFRQGYKDYAITGSGLTGSEDLLCVTELHSPLTLRADVRVAPIEDAAAAMLKAYEVDDDPNDSTGDFEPVPASLAAIDSEAI